MPLLFAFVYLVAALFLRHIISWPILLWGWAVMSTIEKSYLVLRGLDTIGDMLTVDWDPGLIGTPSCVVGWMSINLDWNPFLLLVGCQSNWAPSRSITFSLEIHHHVWYSDSFFSVIWALRIHCYWIFCLPNCLGVKYKLMVNCVHNVCLCTVIVWRKFVILLGFTILPYISPTLVLDSFILLSFDYSQDVREPRGRDTGLEFHETALRLDARHDIILILPFPAPHRNPTPHPQLPTPPLLYVVVYSQILEDQL